jgi:hypothetical protein
MAETPAKQNVLIMTPETVSEITSRPLEEVQKAMQQVKDRKALVGSLMQNPAVKAVFKDAAKLESHLTDVSKTLEKKKSFLGKTLDAGKSVLKTTSKVLGNRWVKLGLLAAAAYFGWKYLPSWDMIMSWLQRLRGKAVAEVAKTAIGSVGQVAAPVTEKLVSGGVAPTNTPNVNVEDIFNALDPFSSGSAPSPAVVGK